MDRLRFWKRADDALEQAISKGTPREHCDAMITYARRKADKNKARSRVATSGLLLTTAAIPVAVILADKISPFWLGKFAPIALAAAATVLGTWVRIERPHERWSLYRGYQRLLEAERIRYEHELEPYDAENRDKRFAAFVADCQQRLHDEWAGLLPTTAELSALGDQARK